jgi:hypothetical protein
MFDRANLPEASNVALFVREARVKIRRDQFLGKRDTDNPRPEHQHVHVVMFDALVSGIGIVAHRCANPRDLVDGDRRADAAAADQYAAFGLGVDDGFTDGFGKIWVIVRGIKVEGADIEDVVAKVAEEIGDVLL